MQLKKKNKNAQCGTSALQAPWHHGAVWSQPVEVCVHGESKLNDRRVTSFVSMSPSPQVTTSAQQKCPGHKRFPATRRSRVRSTSSPSHWPAATPSAMAQAWYNDSWGQPAKRNSRAWSLQTEPGSRWPPPHPLFAMKTDAYQLQPGHRQCGNLERRLPRSRG